MDLMNIWVVGKREDDFLLKADIGQISGVIELNSAQTGARKEEKGKMKERAKIKVAVLSVGRNVPTGDTEGSNRTGMERH